MGMKAFKIGVLSDCLRLGVKEGVRKAAELGAEGVQVYAFGSEMSPEKMDAAGRREFAAFCSDLGLEITALCADAGGGLRNEAENPGKVEHLKGVIGLTADLGTSIVTCHIGVVPENPETRAYQALTSACTEIAGYAAGAGVTFAIETGPEKAATLKKLLDDVGSGSLGVNLDPANLVMVVADDPVQAVHTLKDYIVHTHAKDGIQLRPCDPMEIYHGSTPLELATEFEELPLGEGGVDWDAYLNALEETGYRGYLTIEREAGNERVVDVQKAITFLREKIKT